MIYKWKNGTHVARGLKAQIVGERLESIRQAHGFLTAEMVVMDATHEASPLHPQFEWNDSVAAKKYREDQARHLIAAVVMVREDKPNTTIRAFVVVGEGEGRVYTSTVEALAHDATRYQLLMRARKELEEWKARYEELEEFAAVVEVINQVKVA